LVEYEIVLVGNLSRFLKKNLAKLDLAAMFTQGDALC